MDLRLLRSFVALADELHFGRAAQRVHVVQAALSQHIQDLESEVGARLFDRTTRRVSLTDVGRVLLPEAHGVLAAVDRAAACAKSAARGQSGILRVGFVSAAALSVLPRLLLAFKATSVNVDLELAELGTRAQLDALCARQLDVALVLAPAEVASSQSSLVLNEEPLQAVLPSRHPLAGRRRISLRDLSEDPTIWMVARSEPQLRQHYIRLCQSQGFIPNIKYEVDHVLSMLGLVAAGMGISFAPRSVRLLAPEGVRFVTLTPQIPSSIQLVWERNPLPPVLTNFLSAAKAEFGATRITGT
jgi:DNA-binding transcriptional LysR family regulator